MLLLIIQQHSQDDLASSSSSPTPSQTNEESLAPQRSPRASPLTLDEDVVIRERHQVSGSALWYSYPKNDHLHKKPFKNGRNTSCRSYSCTSWLNGVQINLKFVVLEQSSVWNFWDESQTFLKSCEEVSLRRERPLFVKTI